MKVTLSPLKRSLKILKGSLGSLTWDSWLVMSRHLAVNKLNCICQFEQWKETCFVCLCGSIIQPGSKQGLSWIYAPLFPRDYDIAQFWQSRVLKKPKHFFFFCDGVICIMTWRPSFSLLITGFWGPHLEVLRKGLMKSSMMAGQPTPPTYPRGPYPRK